MKKKMALALSLAMAATTLAPAAVSAADEQVTLTIMSSIQTEDEGKLESAIADAYMEQNPNVKIEFISVANNVYSVFPDSCCTDLQNRLVRAGWH